MKNTKTLKKKSPTQEELGAIRIRKNGKANHLIAEFSPKAINILGVREIVFFEKDGRLLIRRPTLDTKKTITISKMNHFGFSSENSEKLVGGYVIPNEDLDEYKLIRQ